MKRFLAVGLLFGLFAAAAFGDENVRAVQTKLKAAGFYFGETDGALSSDVSAAITRFQIRNGLQITGNLNGETAKALGVNPEVVPAGGSGAPPAETWRQLRQSRGRAGVRAKAQPLPRPAPRRADEARHDSPTTVLEPARDGDEATFALSPERLRDFVGAFVLAGRDPTVGAEVEFFANRVRYYDDGIVSRQKIADDIRRYDTRWPERHFRLVGEPKVEPQPDSRLRVTFPLRFDLVNGSKHSTGKILKTLLLEVVGRDLQIVAVNEKRIR